MTVVMIMTRWYRKGEQTRPIAAKGGRERERERERESEKVGRTPIGPASAPTSE